MKKINIAELLKDCPKGMELDCIMFEDPVKYIGLATSGTYIITIETSSSDVFYLTKEGYLYNTADSKCVIFPKGKTTWEGFVPPCKFKNGDILYIATNDGKYNLCMVDCIIGGILYTKTSCSCNGYFLCTCEEQVNIEELVVMRFATEEEKAKLFQEIKDNGYKWNEETKTLEKLCTIFKVGDKIKLKNAYAKKYDDFNTREITEIKDSHYILDDEQAMPLSNQYLYELVPNKFNITTLVPFESKVLVRYNKESKWCPAVWGFYDYEKGLPHRYAIVGGITFAYCIPYEGNKHLLGTTYDCDDFYKTWE